MKKWKMDNTASSKYVYVEEDDQLARHVATVLVNNYVAKSPEQHHAEATEKAMLIAKAPELKDIVESLLIPSMVMLDDLESTMPSQIRLERIETHKKAKALLDVIANV